MQQHISYRKVRDLSGIFNATFGFIKQNFKVLFSTLLLLAGPFILIYSTITSIAFGSVFNFSRIGTVGPEFIANFIVAYILAILAMIIGISIYNVILFKAVLENETLNPDEKLTSKQLTTGFFTHYWRLLGNMLLFALVISAVILLITALMIAVFSLFTGAGILLGILLVLVLLVVGFIFMPILSYAPMAALFVCLRDKIGIFDAMRKVLRYLKNNFWNTWAVSFISMLTYSSMSMIGQLPVIIITFISTFSRLKQPVPGQESVSLALVIVTGFCSLLTFGVMSIYYLMCIYQYGSLEEKNEGLNVLDKINTI